MLRALLAILCATVILTACTQRMICPAYQSAYIYDKDQLRKRFSYFQEDSTPKIYTASKTKYLIAEPVSYKKKIRSMQTIAARPIKTVLPDSLAIKENEGEGLLGEASADGDVDPGSQLDQAARSVIDSTFIVDVPQDSAAAAEDSVYMISKDKETRVLKYNMPDSLHFDDVSGRYLPETPKYSIVHVAFNVDQDNYMWYLRDYLVLPDVRLAKQQQKSREDDEKAGKSGKKKQKGIKGFFKRLFGKKEAEEPEQPAPAPKKDEEDFDFIEDEEAKQAQEQQAAPQKEKKGLFGRKKKKPEQNEAEETAPPQDTVPVPPQEEKPLVPDPEKEDGF